MRKELEGREWQQVTELAVPPQPKATGSWQWLRHGTQESDLLFRRKGNMESAGGT